MDSMVSTNKQLVMAANIHDEEMFPKAFRKNGKYVIPWETDATPPDNMVNNFKYLFTMDESQVPNTKKLDGEPLMQIMSTDTNRIANAPDNGIRVTWLGHATCLFQSDNINILTNPNFSDSSGSNKNNAGDSKRYRPSPYRITDLPRIDCVLVTNTHHETLCLHSVRQLNDRYGDMLLWYVPMGLCSVVEKVGVKNVVELEWWKEDEIEFIDHRRVGPNEYEDSKVTKMMIACTPSQSFHNRALDGTGSAVLWCSWVLITPRYKIFVSGNSGYCSMFKSIGIKYGPFHMAALPIGGYHPNWKHGYGNITPEQAVQVHKDLLAMCSLATHWGTFSLSCEYYLEPPHRLKTELHKQGLSEMQFFLLKHGESRLLEIKEAIQEDEDQDS